MLCCSAQKICLIILLLYLYTKKICAKLDCFIRVYLTVSLFSMMTVLLEYILKSILNKIFSQALPIILASCIILDAFSYSYYYIYAQNYAGIIGTYTHKQHTTNQLKFNLNPRIYSQVFIRLLVYNMVLPKMENS